MKAPRVLSLWLLAALVVVAAPQANGEVRTYRNPMHQGHRLDYCRAFGQECGERVATQWCRSQGYEYASDWSIARDIGDVTPTIGLEEDTVCSGQQCDGFATITCGREGRTFRLPNLGAGTRATVITPDRRGTAPVVMPVEVQVLVPGCHQREPGELLCETIHEYQHCRTLLRSRKVLGCRAGLAFDGAFAVPHAAAPESYRLSMRSRASASVYEGRRGEGKLKGDARYEIAFAIPSSGSESCLQRDRYVYHPTGPEGGLSTIDDTASCDARINGSFEPHEDDLLRAYDLCEARDAWGRDVQMPIELMVAGLFHFATHTASDAPASGSTTHIVAPYVIVSAPMEVDCKS